MKVILNLNDKVRATLTPAGIRYMHQNQATFMLVHPQGNVIETELWQLATIFGPLFYNGNPEPPILDLSLEVVVQEK